MAEPSEPAPSASPSPQAPTVPGPFTVRSTAFGHQEDIPTKYSCDADNVSPPLRFANVSGAARTFALIMEDPDAPSGTVLHWTFWNVPANEIELPEDVDVPALGGREGQEYRGPCPPVLEHRYFFYGYAVDAVLELAEGASVSELRAALASHTVATDDFYGLYSRVPPLAPRG